MVWTILVYIRRISFGLVGVMSIVGIAGAALAAPESAAPAITVSSASYGSNCGVPVGNVTSQLARSCNGKTTCPFTVAAKTLGNSAPACEKQFEVRWRCGREAAQHRAFLPGIAGSGARQVELSCAVAGEVPKPVVQKLITVRTASYGLNCGAPAGYATAKLAEACNGKASCEYLVVNRILGDPANGCGKEFEVEWLCGGSSVVHHTGLPAGGGDGGGHPVQLSCEKK